MEGTKLRVSRTGREAMAALARLRDGDAALLYAYAASRDGGCTPAQAAQALDFSPEQMEKASQLLLVYGLAVNHTAPPPRQAVSPAPAHDSRPALPPAISRKTINRKRIRRGKIQIGKSKFLAKAFAAAGRTGVGRCAGPGPCGL